MRHLLLCLAALLMLSCAAADSGADGDCRTAALACGPGFACLEGSGGFACVPAGADSSGYNGTTDLSSGPGPAEDTHETPDVPDVGDVSDSGLASEDAGGVDVPPLDAGPEDSGAPAVDAGVQDVAPDVPIITDVPQVIEDTGFDAGPPDVQVVEDTGPEDVGPPPAPLQLQLVPPGQVLSAVSSVKAVVTGGGQPLGVEFQIDGMTIGTDIIPPYTMAINTVQWKDGEHTIQAFTADVEGGKASDSKTVVFDNTPPQFVSVSPPENGTVFYEDGPLVIRAEVADSAPLASVSFRANGLLVGEFVTPPFEATVENKNLFISEDQLPKNVYLQFRAEDTLGQVTEISHNIEIHKRLLWTFPTLGEIWGGAVALPNGNVVFGNLNSKVFCVSDQGQEVWSVTASGGVTLAPAVDSATGNVYFGSLEGKIHGVTQAGASLFTADIQSPPGGSLAVKGDTLYVAAFSGAVRAMNKNNGNKIWEVSLPDFISSSPVVAEDGTVYVGCQDGSLYAIKDGEIGWNAETADEIWSSPSIGPNEAIYFGSNDGWVYAIKKNGLTLWETEINGQIWGRPLVTDDYVVYVASTSKYLHKLDGTDGSQIWSVKLEGMSYSSPVMDVDGTIYIGTTSGVLYALDPETGKARFKYTIGGTIHATPLIANDRVYVGSTDRDLFCLWRNGASLMQPVGE